MHIVANVVIDNEVLGIIKLENIEALKEHEQIDENHVRELAASILSEGIKVPIVADKKTKIVLDGHHRLKALKELGARKIFVLYVDYFDSRIVLDSWNGKRLTKEIVVNTVKSGRLFPIKTTKHMVLSREGIKHISSVVPSRPADVLELNSLREDYYEE